MGSDVNKCLLLVLADSEDVLKETVDLLENGKFRQWLATDHLAICRSKPVEKAEVPEKEK